VAGAPAVTASAAIRTSGLTKDFGSRRGVFDLSLEVAAGEIFGFLGPNGAGKTTTIRTLMNLIRPTGGRAEIFGLDCRAQSVEVKRLVGYLPGELPEWGGLRGREVVAYIAGLRGTVEPALVSRLSERFGLDLGRRYREYSSGNRRKLGLLLAFMHGPRLLLLDEPTNGLDPLNQHEFFKLVGEARDGGAAIFLSSHVLSEVERVCQRVAIIRNGRLAQVAALETIHRLRYHTLEVDFAGQVPLAAIEAAPGVDQVATRGGHVTCRVRGDFNPLLRALETGNVVSLLSHEPSLEEVFLAYYEDPATEDAPGDRLGPSPPARPTPG